MIRFDAGSLRIALRSMNTTLASERRAAEGAVLAAGRILFLKVKQNISLSDHSLADLARMDHPYAVRHGSIQIHKRGTKSLNNPENRVHTQSGKLLSALKGTSHSGGLGYRVELDPSIAPHAVQVVLGTKVMLPRDVVWDTASAPEVRKLMMRAIVTVLGKQFRSQGGVRFGSGGPGPGTLGV